MNDELINKLISYLVEKVTKGVRKQLKGYVKNIEDEISISVNRINYVKNEFHVLYDQSKFVRADFQALEMMIKESTRQKKLYLELREMFELVNDKLMDMNLIKIEIENQLKMLKKIKGCINE